MILRLASIYFPKKKLKIPAKQNVLPEFRTFNPD
jgi:hypothetical protein